MGANGVAASNVVVCSTMRGSLTFGLVACWAAALAGCTFDFDAPFADAPPEVAVDAAAPSDVHEAGDAGEAGGETSLDGCWPSCAGKCPGADNGCGTPCADDDCAGTCCGAACCGPAEVCGASNTCCAPESCASLGAECGSHANGCGGSTDCGSCASGTCSSSGRCTDCPFDSCSGVCCGEGQVCNQAGACCSPVSCSQLGAQCGAHEDGCGNSISCGTCSSDWYCFSGNTCSPAKFTFRTVPAGSFTMGSPTSEPGRDVYQGPFAELDEREHLVSLTYAFEVADTEVTQADFEVLMGYQPSYFVGCGSDCPVERVTWDEAAAFCNALSELKSLPPCFACSGSGPSVSCSLSPAFQVPYDCAGYRLPTEAEWERAARATTQTAFHSGPLQKPACDELDANLGAIGWYFPNAQVSYGGAVDVPCGAWTAPMGSHPIRQRQANGFGLYDVAGNVWEWVHDCPAPYVIGPQTNPVGPSTCDHAYKLYRGGGAGNLAAYCRHAERASYAQDGKNLDIGFRPARTLL